MQPCESFFIHTKISKQVEKAKIVGRIVIPIAPKKHKYLCDTCKSVLDNSWGEPGIKITTLNSSNDSSNKWICVSCYDDLLND